MRPRPRRIWTALAVATASYLAAVTAGAGAALGAMLLVGVAGEIWFWSELLRGWLTKA